MRAITSLVVVGACTSFGCNIAHYAGKNVVNEPHLATHDVRLPAVLSREARSLLEHDGVTRSPAYIDGFADGYTNQAMYGGPPCPPGVAPAHYRNDVRDYSADGQDAQSQYLQGFEAGAKRAVSCRRRDQLFVRAAWCEEPAAAKLIIQCTPAPPTANLKPVPASGLTRPPALPPPTSANPPVKSNEASLAKPTAPGIPAIRTQQAPTILTGTLLPVSPLNAGPQTVNDRGTER